MDLKNSAVNNVLELMQIKKEDEDKYIDRLAYLSDNGVLSEYMDDIESSVGIVLELIVDCHINQIDFFNEVERDDDEYRIASFLRFREYLDDKELRAAASIMAASFGKIKDIEGVIELWDTQIEEDNYFGNAFAERRYIDIIAEEKDGAKASDFVREYIAGRMINGFFSVDKEKAEGQFEENSSNTDYIFGSLITARGEVRDRDFLVEEVARNITPISSFILGEVTKFSKGVVREDLLGLSQIVMLSSNKQMEEKEILDMLKKHQGVAGEFKNSLGFTNESVVALYVILLNSFGEVSSELVEWAREPNRVSNFMKIFEVMIDGKFCFSDSDGFIESIAHLQNNGYLIRSDNLRSMTSKEDLESFSEMWERFLLMRVGKNFKSMIAMVIDEKQSLLGSFEETGRAGAMELMIRLSLINKFAKTAKGKKFDAKKLIESYLEKLRMVAVDVDNLVEMADKIDFISTEVKRDVMDLALEMDMKKGASISGVSLSPKRVRF